MADNDGQPSLGELSRSVRDVLVRFQDLANKLETQFISKEVFRLYSDGVTREIENVQKTLDQAVAVEKERNDRIKQDIASLQNNVTWIVRIVLATVIVAVLAAIGFSKAGGGG